MKSKLIWAIIIIGLIVISQFLAVKMIYAHKISGVPAHWLADIYNLKAGVINEELTKDDITISLEEYFENQNFVEKFLSKTMETPLDKGTIYNFVWDKLIRSSWLNRFADSRNLKVSDEEMEYHLASINNIEDLKTTAQNDFGLSFEEYKDLVIRPFILEAKVYEYLLDNYNDISGIQKAEAAYTALESGDAFTKVAEEFSDDLNYVDNSIWLTSEDLVDFYEPIKDLKEGEFGKIVLVPGAYVIWYVQSIEQEIDLSVWEVKGILIQAKTMDEFFQDYLNYINIQKFY
ncbi:MAG: hypothetical protein COV55_00075 [Candidatus Komeilibacteria bacterium CG11_big_fil_rev_8_21_14_0_20_36_20]|uniref:PpiC domain-containing protein n=1 Tax=Candidatus Komeilibacteria bacterium CG11_big_fil_rev_8_21_14_0_20_36_20 TaxID=1974477 RepID=A0A2H0NEP9_9BACT|nr:MAG: hypothetical protein COV55_00075 [Candidatus Komeilibacteria bacterium CG11_big_fil_rev_8_21_14_0_20_36_20]PJC55756.1 MAG: hypothetical protein CO027_00340 [Candidatus Komeilibacteria bacterium CG_4_9_14_0_2_um_filter_36_13]